MIKLKLALLVFVSLLIAGCGSSPKVEVVDLNKVLDIMMSTLDKMKKAKGDKKSADKATKEEKDKFMKEFNTLYAIELNKAKITSKPIGTVVNADGSITGYADINKNKTKDFGETDLFKVEIDFDRSRLIASDLQNGYRRDHGFSMGGFVAGMILGNMLSRQRGAGIGGKRFSNSKMSPKNYHSGAVSKAKSRAAAKSRAKSRSRSGSFSRGK